MRSLEVGDVARISHSDPYLNGLVVLVCGIREDGWHIVRASLRSDVPPSTTAGMESGRTRFLVRASSLTRVGNIKDAPWKWEE